MNTWITSLVAVLIVLALCGIGLAFGMFFGRKSVSSCGRAAAKGMDNDMACPSCGCGSGCSPTKKS